jgi:hypothetical protein
MHKITEQRRITRKKYGPSESQRWGQRKHHINTKRETSRHLREMTKWGRTNKDASEKYKITK